MISRILERSVSQSSLGEPEVPKIEALARLGSNSSFSNLVGRDNETPTNEFPQAHFQNYSSVLIGSFLKDSSDWLSENLKIERSLNVRVRIGGHQFPVFREPEVIKV